jgi:nuclear GTP-binding protein
MGNGKINKKSSKRQTTKLRVKVEKKVRDHARKLKKEKKKNPGKFVKSKKDPGVPADCPFKDQVLAEAQDAIEKRNVDKEKRRVELKEMRKTGKLKKMTELRGQTLESLAAGAARRTKMFDGAAGVVASAERQGCTDRSAKAYYREFRKVVTAADVVLEVLDARDPLGSRCREVEQTVAAQTDKRLVLVLNKADLVPRENLQAWVQHLRHEFPTIAFKASTQNSARLGQAKIDLKASDAVIHTSKCVGADTLLNLLGNYCRNKDVKTSIRVGVVGLPNVGKSSLINSLKRSRACPTGATPGVTKAMQEVTLDSKIKLLDCPGMVLASGNMTDASVALKNAIKVESLADPVTPVVAIMGRVPRQHLMLHYGIGAFADCAEFLAKLAIQLGKLKKGGVPDRDTAARIVLGDWNSGKIKYCTHPPETAAATEEASAIVAEFAREFSMEELERSEKMDLQNLPLVRPSEMVDVEASQINDKAAEMEEDEMEVENDENILPANLEVFAKKGKRQEREFEKKKEKEDPLFKIEGNQRLEKAAKMVAKKNRKERRRNERVGETLANQMDDAFSKLTG